MKSALRILLFCLVVLGVSGALVWGFLAGRSEQAAEAEGDAAIEATPRTSSQGGQTFLSFDEAAQRANSIVVSALAADRHTPEEQATGIVLQLQPLLDLKASYDTAVMNIAKARASARASDEEYRRLQQLNQGGPNVSQKAVETARAISESDQAVLKNAEQSVVVLDGSTKLRWGNVLATWLKQSSPQLDALFEQRSFLLQVTALSGVPSQVNSSTRNIASAPTEVMVQLPGGNHASAHLISALPLLDARLQAPSFLYSVSAHPGIVPGMNLSVFLPSGPSRSGVVVPYSAAVWWQGRAWCYIEKSPGKFAREQVLTSTPEPNGWFITERIPPGTRVVTSGAQTLFSEEFRSQIQSDED